MTQETSKLSIPQVPILFFSQLLPQSPTRSPRFFLASGSVLRLQWQGRTPKNRRHGQSGVGGENQSVAALGPASEAGEKREADR